MASVPFFNRRFTPDWRMVLIAMIAIAFFTRLGFWQMARAVEKQQMVEAKTQGAAQAPVALTAQKAAVSQYQTLSVQGNYLSHTFLLDNQHYQHQFGYDVLTPLQLASGEVVLVDRGFVPGDSARSKLPMLTTPTALVSLTGYAYYPSAKGWMLGPAWEERGETTVIERIDVKIVEQILHKSLYPFIIRLDKDAHDGYVREWPVVSMPPARHYAYAMQWFAIAFVVFILFIALNLKKRDN